MSVDAELLNEIKRMLATIQLGTTFSSKSTSDIFEAYVLCLLLKAAQREGATIAYEDVKGKTPSSLIFRTSPAQIYSDKKPYCHAIIEFANKPLLEAHIGIRVSGKSKVLHECDVAVIFRDEGITCRNHSVPPRHSKLILAVECKFYTDSISLIQARAFIGLSADLKADDCFFVVNTDSGSAEKLLAHRRNNWEHRIIPRSQNEVSRLIALFQNHFKNFKAKN
jgi:hypothetical protein